MVPVTSTPPSQLALLRKKCLEDFDIQVAAARVSIERGLFATARAELRGAVFSIDALEPDHAAIRSRHAAPPPRPAAMPFPRMKL